MYIYIWWPVAGSALSHLRGRLFACPTTDQIKAQTKKHILGAMVYPNNVQLQKVVRKRISSQEATPSPWYVPPPVGVGLWVWVWT